MFKRSTFATQLPGPFYIIDQHRHFGCSTQLGPWVKIKVIQMAPTGTLKYTKFCSRLVYEYLQASHRYTGSACFFSSKTLMERSCLPWTIVLSLWTTILTYLCPSLPVEHRPSTTPRHRTLFWAALVIPDQLVPCCFSSASVSRLQLLRGRPLFLFPYGFQVRAWRVVLDAGFLRVCPIQPHFLRSICLATGSCPARSHSSSFRIFSCHWIL